MLEKRNNYFTIIVIKALFCSLQRKRLARTRVSAHRGELSRQVTVNQPKHLLTCPFNIPNFRILFTNILKYINDFKIGEEIRWHCDFLWPMRFYLSAFTCFYFDRSRRKRNVPPPVSGWASLSSRSGGGSAAVGLCRGTRTIPGTFQLRHRILLPPCAHSASVKVGEGV